MHLCNQVIISRAVHDAREGSQVGITWKACNDAHACIPRGGEWYYCSGSVTQVA